MKLTGTTWNRTNAYFFRGGRYARYNVALDRADSGYSWPITGMPASFTSDLDAIVRWPTGYAYFFKSAQYVKYNMDPQHEGAMPNYPRPIAISVRHGSSLSLVYSRQVRLPTYLGN